ncbi:MULTISPECIES: hypothetical protein [unclassified Bacillus (in: firmicutes)]|uniref:hypothetical protein n=1 Tax=unclassified Bacillus (in: firmicutes) TaxID=185979 RepID=UPI001145F345|nr:MULTISPECIES: hypothetical protein [unclassified Bacillus (in: firmicutes)]
MRNLVVKFCTKCQEPIERVERTQLKAIHKAASRFKGSNKKEMNEIKLLALKFSNQKICEYCYLEEMARLTTILRIKAMQYTKCSS